MGPHSSCALGWPEARWGLAVLSTEGAQRRPGVLALNWALFSTEGGKETGKGDAFSPWRSTLVNACRTLWLFRRSVVSDSLRPHGLQHARPPCPSPSPGVGSNPCPLSRWCQPTISSSVVPFSSCLQSFPACTGFYMNIKFSFHLDKFLRMGWTLNYMRSVCSTEKLFSKWSYYFTSPTGIHVWAFQVLYSLTASAI